MTPSAPTTRRALLALASLSALLLVNAAPLAHASAGAAALDGGLVGALLVDAQGRVQGHSLAATLDESTGAIDALAAGGAPVFSHVDVDGFAATGKAEGVASPVLTLRGSDAVLSLVDGAQGALRIAVDHAVDARFDLAPGVSASPRTAGVLDLVDADGTLVGSLVAAGADGASSAASSFQVDGASIVAHAAAGSDVLFLGADAAHPDISRAVADAVARGDLASALAIDLAHNAVERAQLAGSSAYEASTSVGPGSVSTLVSSSGAAAPAVLSYDLSYEALPVHAADDVAVYVDGQLATRAQSAQDVRDLAQQGVPSFDAVVDQGRTLVLAATSDFLGSSDHHVAIEASHAQTLAQALAEQGARADVAGDLSLLSDGKLDGSFVSGAIGQGGALLSHFTTLATGTELVSALTVDGNRQGAVVTLDPEHVRVMGSQADLTLVDDANGAFLLDANAATEATLRLADGVKAEPQLSNVIQLAGPTGAEVGSLVLVDHDITRHASSLSASGGDVRATLAKGARLVFRGSGDGFSTDGTLAEAIGSGRIGAELLAGDSPTTGLSTATVSYAQGTLADISSRAARGTLDVEYASADANAKAFVVEAAGSALAAKDARDVLVLVDGEPTIPVSNAATALAMGSQARSFVETASDGHAIRIVVNAAQDVGKTAHVRIESRLGNALSQGDAFGSFKLFQDGTAVGSFVKLHAERAAGAVSGVELLSQGREVVRSLSAGGAAFEGSLQQGASTLVLSSSQSRISVTDAASPEVVVSSLQPRVQAALALAPGVHAREVAPDVLSLSDDSGARLGSIVLADGGKGALHVDGERVGAQLDAGDALVYHAQGELSDDQQAALDGAVARGYLAGHVLAGSSAALEPSSLPAADAAAATPDLTSTASAEYGDVSMVAHATQDRVDITVSSASSAGRAILVTLDPSTVADLASGEAQVLLDGVSVRQATSLADALDPANAGEASALVLSGESGAHVLVTIPHFSTHTVTIQSARSAGAAGAGSPGYLYASVFLGLLVAVETALLIRNRNRSR